MFNDEPSSLSKTTRADKRTSSFPFANKASARSIKDRLRWQPTRPGGQTKTQTASVRQRTGAGPAAADPLGVAGEGEAIELQSR